MTLDQGITFCSVNCQGLGDYNKRKDVFEFLRKKQYDVFFLQDTHIPCRSNKIVRAMWGHEVWLSGLRSDSGGVAFLFRNSFQFKVYKVVTDIEGHYLILKIMINDKMFVLVNLYAPSHGDVPDFFDKIEEELIDIYTGSEIMIFGGDYNVFLDEDIDCMGYNQKKYKNNMRDRIFELMSKWQLIDIWREQHSDSHNYTWRRINPLQQSRLDYFLISEFLLTNNITSGIDTSYRSDHSPVVVKIAFNEKIKTSPFWKLNNSLLKDLSYLNIVKEVIKAVRRQYAVEQEDLNLVDNIPDTDLELMINDSLFLETLLMEIRASTIQYAAQKKRERNKQEKDMLEAIHKLEQNLTEENKYEYEMLKEELKHLRNYKIQGMIVRSRMRWEHEGEKNTKYFFSLENRHYVCKAMLSLKASSDSKEIILDQQHILKEVKTFYQNLYALKLNTNNIDLNVEITEDVPKLTENELKSLEGLISVEEAFCALKGMKHNKSPGTDGFSVEFFKMFWKHLGVFIVRSANYCFKNEELSVTQKQGVIVCIPKENKNKQELTNWRPITLLNVVYKIISTCIANRIKTVLNKLIHHNQSGFMSGRFMGENVRLLYDIMYYAETKNLPGLLLQIDFEKAFDSIVHTFIIKCLNFFNFGPDIQKWISTFYKNCISCVNVNGQFTEWFAVERGVRQGDPVSPYLFLLCAEILGILVRSNKDIIGIQFEDKMCKISQFADDTGFTLDGTETSFYATLEVLDKFADMSGLKVNYDKTNAVWFGSTRRCLKRFVGKHPVVWDPVIFRVLGIKFSVELDMMAFNNYAGKLVEIKKLLLVWSQRDLTPFGKICILKTLIMSRITHLLLMVPDPPSEFLKEINTLFFSFLWNKKPDKLRRNTVKGNLEEGGLGMVDIFAVCKSLKVTWIRRLLTKDSNWTALVKNLFPSVVNIKNFGPCFLTKIIKNCKNQFWVDVFTHFKEFQERVEINKFQDFLGESIHYNCRLQINKQPIVIERWINLNILKVSDIVDNDGLFYTFEKFKEIYSNEVGNYLQYYGVVSAASAFLKAQSIKSEKKTKVSVSLWWNILHARSKGAQEVRKVFTVKNHKPIKALEKWKEKFEYVLNWKKIFKTVYLTTQDPRLRWFQIKVIYRILPTDKWLYACGIKSLPLCTRCENYENEDIPHLLWNCDIAQKFWDEVLLWIRTNVEGKSNYFFEPDYILLASNRREEREPVLDLIVLLGKHYLYVSKCKESLPGIAAFKKIVHRKFVTEKEFFVKNNRLEVFQQKWSTFFKLVETT